jgi:hypothetical protein
MPETVSAGIAAPPRREFLGVAAYTVFPQAGSAKLARVNAFHDSKPTKNASTSALVLVLCFLV